MHPSWAVPQRSWALSFSSPKSLRFNCPLPPGGPRAHFLVQLVQLFPAAGSAAASA